MLRRLRETLNQSGCDLGHVVGLSRDAISKLERGKRQPSLTVFVRLTEALNLTDTEAMTLARELAAPHATAPASQEAA